MCPRIPGSADLRQAPMSFVVARCGRSRFNIAIYTPKGLRRPPSTPWEPQRSSARTRRCESSPKCAIPRILNGRAFTANSPNTNETAREPPKQLEDQRKCQKPSKKATQTPKVAGLVLHSLPGRGSRRSGFSPTLPTARMPVRCTTRSPQPVGALDRPQTSRLLRWGVECGGRG